MLLPWDEPEKPMRELTPEEIKDIDERFTRASASASLSDRAPHNDQASPMTRNK